MSRNPARNNRSQLNPSTRYRLTRRGALTLGGGAVLGAAAGLPGLVLPANAATLDTAFDKAASKYGVPRDLLVAVGYTETRLDNHGGKPSAANGYGIMHLVRNPEHHTLDEAIAETSLSAAKLRSNNAANIEGAAAVLRGYADDMGVSAGSRKDLNAWYPVVARYSGASENYVAALYADAVYGRLAAGAADGEVSLSTTSVDPDKSGIAATSSDIGILSTDYPPAHWRPAHSSNYTNASRPGSNPINYVVIHTTQGSYAGSISWFQNPASNVSAHYIVRSNDGDVSQCVDDADIAWHAGNWTYNQRSIGIEHEGFVSNPDWYTEAMYQASGALTKYKCDQFGIPKTRSRIIAHSEVPGADHTDPGQYWDWGHYMDIVTGGGGDVTWQTTIDNLDGRVTVPGSWGQSGWNSEKKGTNYFFNTPQAISETVWYYADLPSSGNYRVQVWYPSDSGYNNKTPYIVNSNSDFVTKFVDQRSGGGAWRSIGTFSMAAGNHSVVGVSRWTGGTGYVIADAVRVQRLG